jgi:hypothetical protein
VRRSNFGHGGGLAASVQVGRLGRRPDADFDQGINAMRRIRVLSAAIAVLMMYVAAATAEPPVKQVQLSETQVQAVIAAQPEMSAILEKVPEDERDNPPPDVQAQFEASAKKHGFKNFQEYDDVALNIYLVWSAIDPETRIFTEPSVAIKKDVADVSADKTLSADEKKKILEELNDALNSMQPTQFPRNIELVKKYYDKIKASLN